MKLQTLLSLPPAATRFGLSDLPSVAFAGGDPPGRQLGSGGGTAFLLAEAWRALAPEKSPGEWLAESAKLVIHASGQSRRLPAYAAEGKSRLPVPRMAGRVGQTRGQTLVDVQVSDFARLLRHAPGSYRLAVACGDTLVNHPGPMPRFPEADVLVVGIPSSPEEACAHGVLFSPPRDASGRIEFFLHKPSPERIEELARSFDFSLDSGLWLFSERAVRALLSKCGWDDSARAFRGGVPNEFDLYDRFGTALGAHPSDPDPALSGLTSAVMALPDGRFYHFGTSRSVFHSVAQLVHPADRQRAFGHAEGPAEAPDRFVLGSDAPGVPDSVRPLWIENASVPPSWTLSGGHVLTGLPPNEWTVALPRGVCVDATPLLPGAAPGAAPGAEALRVYGFDDAFKGAIGLETTTYLGRPFPEWLRERGLSFEDCGLDPGCDIQNAPLFPLLDWSDPAGAAVLQWMAGPPDAAPDGRKAWLSAPRVSATDIVQKGDLAPRIARRDAHLRAEAAATTPEGWAADAVTLDLSATAAAVKRGATSAPPPLPEGAPPLARIHDAVFRKACGHTAPDAFALLREAMVSDLALTPVRPRRDLLDNQIVWGRAPARLDLAGGWSDTPPYCLEHGGCVVNVAVDLNGQPPIQAFATVRPDPKIVLHSIDLGVSETIESYEALCAPSALGPFSIPRAALRLAGFDPRFADGAAPTLAEQLRRTMGGGLEISTLAAIPKGSGLGTSSILAATVLGVLGETCSLRWTQRDLFARTTVLEQLLGSGGGWQDQVGGLAPGAKISSTRPGMRQTPDVRYLPEGMLGELFRSGRAMLYYTGRTRVARSILGEIVQSIFLDGAATVSRLEDIAANALFAADAIQRADESALAEAIRRSWALNNELDAGTCPPEIAPLVAAFESRGAAVKLLGAGGGGYLLALAPDPAVAAEIRDALRRDPPNPGARFVSPSLSPGLQITRS